MCHDRGCTGTRGSHGWENKVRLGEGEGFLEEVTSKQRPKGRVVGAQEVKGGNQLSIDGVGAKDLKETKERKVEKCLGHDHAEP